MTYEEAKQKIAIKHKLGTTLVTGHRATYFEEAALLYADQFKVKNLANVPVGGSKEFRTCKGCRTPHTCWQDGECYGNNKK